jgi:ubiquinone/menaquinone biosynthesis C-methylase UbiE
MMFVVADILASVGQTEMKVTRCWTSSRCPPADRLLDVGAGAGWPGLYFAHVAGCHLTLLDLPESGLRIARERAVVDGIDAQVQTVQGDAADMPLTASSMSAISHSDVLCCLQKKYETLAECRRVICDGGRMAFFRNLHSSWPSRCRIAICN